MSVQRPITAAYNDENYRRVDPTSQPGGGGLTEPVIVISGTVASGIKAAIGRRVEMQLTRRQLEELIEFYDRCEQKWPWSPPEEAN